MSSGLCVRMLATIQANLQRRAGRKGMPARFVGMTFLTCVEEMAEKVFKMWWKWV